MNSALMTLSISVINGLGDIEYISEQFAKSLYGSLPEVEEKKAGKEAK